MKATVIVSTLIVACASSFVRAATNPAPRSRSKICQFLLEHSEHVNNWGTLLTATAFGDVFKRRNYNLRILIGRVPPNDPSGDLRNILRLRGFVTERKLVESPRPIEGYISERLYFKRALALRLILSRYPNFERDDHLWAFFVRGKWKLFARGMKFPQKFRFDDVVIVRHGIVTDVISFLPNKLRPICKSFPRPESF